MKRKPRIFAPLTLKMVQEAGVGPDEFLEIDGEQMQDVSRLVKVLIHIFLIII